MSEYKIQIREILKLLCVVVFASLYAFGGTGNLWLRRYIAPIWITLSMYLFTRDKRVFFQAPLLMLTLSLGYGADVIWTKILKRSIFGMANGSTALVQAFISKRWKLLCFHIPLCILVCVFFGVFNPFGSARAEELAIGFIIGWLPIYMEKEKGSC